MDPFICDEPRSSAGHAPADGIMKAVQSDRTLARWDDVLDRQTRLFGPAEVKHMVRAGLGRGCRGILEVGAASGSYGSMLSSRFPGVPVYGIESNIQFVHRARERGFTGATGNYSVDLCKVGSEPLPPRVRGRFDQAVCRLVLQHTADPAALLRAVHRELPRGGRIFVIEEDTRLFGASPGFEAFERTLQVWRDVCKAEGSDSDIGSKLPRLLLESGFECASMSVIVHSTLDHGAELIGYMSSVLRMFHLTSPHIFSREALQRLVTDLQGATPASPRHFGIYSCVIAVGRKRAPASAADRYF